MEPVSANDLQCQRIAALCLSIVYVFREPEPLADDVRFEKVFLWPQAPRLSLKT